MPEQLPSCKSAQCCCYKVKPAVPFLLQLPCICSLTATGCFQDSGWSKLHQECEDRLAQHRPGGVRLPVCRPGHWHRPCGTGRHLHVHHHHHHLPLEKGRLHIYLPGRFASQRSKQLHLLLDPVGSDCALLCSAVPCYALLCPAMPFCALLYSAVPSYIVLSLAVLCCALLCPFVPCCSHHQGKFALQEQKKNRRLRRRSSKQTLLLSPDRQDSMTEDGEGKSRSESMLDVARGLSASLQNIRRSATASCKECITLCACDTVASLTQLHSCLCSLSSSLSICSRQSVCLSVYPFVFLSVYAKELLMLSVQQRRQTCCWASYSCNMRQLANRRCVVKILSRPSIYTHTE